MAKKVYAIKEGFDSKNNIKVENKIVNTWAECLSYVKGVKGAKYKSFESLSDAKAYLEDTKKLLKKGVDKYPEDCLHIYVDGSYNIATERYSYGLVVVDQNVVKYIESGGAVDNSKKNIRQIAGELEASMQGAKYALNNGYKKVVLFHDYEGIFHHATGSWERKENSSQEYYTSMNELMSKGLEIIFVKVDSHTGDFFNELADECCKEKLGISSDKIVEKWLRDNTLYVANQEIKEQVLKLVNNYEDNIVVVNEKSSLETSKDEKIDIKKEIINIIDKLSEEEQIELLKSAQSILKKF